MSLKSNLRPQFLRSHRSTPDLMERAHREENLGQIESLSHILKTEAAHLGFHRLAQLSQQLEGSSRSGRLPEVSDWHAELTRVLRELGSEPAVPTDAGPLPEEQVEPILRRLLQVVDCDLQQAFDYAQKLDSRFQAIQVALEEFDLEQVRKHCERWLQLRILIVDDSIGNVLVLKHYLGGIGRIVTASTGLEALEIAQRQPLPDLVLLDVHLPDLSGYEVCRQLKESERTRNIAILFATGLSSPEEKERGLQLGAVDYLTKPYHEESVQARVLLHSKTLGL